LYEKVVSSKQVYDDNNRYIGKFPDCIIVTASVKEDEKGDHGHTPASAVKAQCFYTSAFSTSCFPLAAMDGKIEQRVCIKFCVKLGKSPNENLEMLREAFGEHSLSRTAVLNGIHVSRPVECQLKMMKFQGDQAPAKRQNMMKNFRTHPRRPSPNNP
jgi:hypothetical protein